MKRITCLGIILSLSFYLVHKCISQPGNQLIKGLFPNGLPMPNLASFIHWGVYSVPSWAPANAPIGVYAKYAEWYWYKTTVNSGEEYKYFRAFRFNHVWTKAQIP